MQLVDCDVHIGPSLKLVLEHMKEPYRSEIAEKGIRVLRSGVRNEDGGNRWDTAGSVAAAQADLLNVYGHRYALVVTGHHVVAGIMDPDYSAAYCRAQNTAVLEEWIQVDDRLLYAILVPLQDPQAAVSEIEHWVGHPRVKAVTVWGGAERIPFGQRFYWPIYEAANRHGLPIHVHPATTAVIASCATSAAGPVTNFLQLHTCLPQFYQAHLISLVLEGVFERFPNLRIALVEGGFAWVPHVLWRMDKEYKGLRQQAPHLRRLPSEYVRDHIKFGTQPIEEPSKIEHLCHLIDMMGGPEMLMYASDYPHFDFDPPSVLPKRLGEDALAKILCNNAAEFFNLDL